MVTRGRLAYDDQNRLVEIDPDATDPTDPTASEIHPVEVEDLVADLIRFADSATDPAAAGEVRLNGTDVKVYSGGAVQNLSDIIAEGNIDHDAIDQTTVDSADHHTKTQPSDITSANWNDYELQKDGTDGTGIINFKTT